MSKPALRRELNLWGATAFVVTSMVGTGIFTVPAIVRAATVNGLEALGVWLAGALLALCGALCYAELATRMPHAGGEYQYLSRVFGPMWGFVSGWVTFFVGFAAPIAASALGVVAYLQAAFPTWEPNTPLGLGKLTQGALLAALLPLVLAAWHSLGVHSSGRLQSLLMFVLLASICLLVGAGWLTGRGDWRGVTQTTQPVASFWVALLQVSYAYTGWNGAAYLAGEVHEPRRNLPRALIGGTLLVVAVYVTLNLLFLYAVPVNEWTNNVAIGSAAAEHLFGAQGGRLVSAIIAFTILGSLSAWTAAGARVYYAMALDGLAPASFKLLSKRSNAPVLALYAQAIVAALLALTGKFVTILTYVGAGLALFSAFTIFALFVLRAQDTGDELHFRTPLFPLPALVFLLMVAYSCVQSFREAPIPTSAAFMTLFAGFGFFSIGRALGWLAHESNI
jgi:APA family basic amino acid/polyamine antiporter